MLITVHLKCIYKNKKYVDTTFSIGLHVKILRSQLLLMAWPLNEILNKGIG